MIKVTMEALERIAFERGAEMVMHGTTWRVHVGSRTYVARGGVA